jgi:serine/threonine protein kinase
LFAADPERLARFEREAHLLASLNHPHLAAIYGFEESNASRALVLELVEGPTSRSASPTVRFRSLTHFRLRVRSPAPSRRHTSRESFIGISNPRTSRCGMTAR